MLRFRVLPSAIIAFVLLNLLAPSVVAETHIQDDDPLTEAQNLLSKGHELLQSAQYEAALDKFEAALPLYHRAGDVSNEALCLLLIGFVKDQLADYAGALEAYQSSLIIWREIGDSSGEGTTLNNIGLVYYKMGKYDQAMEFYQEALTIARAIGDREGEGTRLGNIGSVYQAIGQYELSLEYLLQALTIAQSIGDQEGESSRLANIGVVYYSLGQYSRAIDYFESALSISKKVGDRVGEGVVLNNIGLAYENLGQYELALDYYTQALSIAQETGDRFGEGTTLGNIGTVYRILGQTQQAMGYYQDALSIARVIGDRRGEATALHNIGRAYDNVGQFQQGLDYYHQALIIEQELGDRAGQSTTLNNIGAGYYDLGEYDQAIDYYQQALTISQDLGNRDGEATAINNLGKTYESKGNIEKALDYYQRALVIVREIGDRNGEGTTLDNIGLIYDTQGDVAQAIVYYKDAISVIESLQTDIRVEEFKASFIAERVGVYERLVNLLYSEALYEDAFQYAERSRARAFLDQLAADTVDIRAGVNSDLLAQEQLLKVKIAARRQEVTGLKNRPITEWDTVMIAQLEADLQQLETDYSELLIEIKSQSPEVASILTVSTLSLTDVQQLLDSETSLVEYFVTDERIIAFLITHDSFDVVATNLPRDELEATIAAFRGFASLDNTSSTELHQLYEWLIAPLKDRLITSSVGIIPHGPLHYVPFAALNDGVTYFGDQYVLFNLPSASVWNFILEKRKSKADTLLVLGNPTTNEVGLARLYYAQQEAMTIADIYNTQALIGEAATETQLYEEAPGSGILHIAAHGQYNPYNPLFSTLFLAADATNDGRLEVHEIYGLDLTQYTNLVVLSACETQVGAVSDGDEVVGLTRAFIFAGTPSVIASLWTVDDRATSLLMGQFYTYLRNGMGKGQALQRAQADVRAQYPHPYYWAAFVLTGDPGEIISGPSNPVLQSASTIPVWAQWGIGICSGIFLFVCCGFGLGIVGGGFGFVVHRRGKTKRSSQP